MADYGRKMDEVLKLINSKCISLDSEEIKNSNELLKSQIEGLLIPKMIESDALFKEMYSTIAFGGSYYDGLKVEKPDEFDLDLKLTVPKCIKHNKKKCKECIKITSDGEAPGFVHFIVKKTQSEKFNSFIDEDDYVQNDRIIKKWFKGLIDSALDQIKDQWKEEATFESVQIIDKEKQDLPSTENENRSNGLPIKRHSESGPAITLLLQGKDGEICIDLVPAFEFDKDYWPIDFRSNTSEQKDVFLIVPKKCINFKNCERYWRASFQEQESELIHGKERLKPALKLLKKMRTSYHKSIPSYALKTIVLWDLESSSPIDYSKSLGECFLNLVETYRDHLYDKEIRYYWKEENNLLNMKSINITLEGHYNHITKMLDILKKEPSNPYEIAKLVLVNGSDEYEDIISEMKANDEKYHISDYDSYKGIEPYLHKINRKYIQPEKTKRKTIKSFVLNDLLPKMKSENTFKNMCKGKIFFIDNHIPWLSQISHSLCIVLSLPKCESCNIRNCECVSLSQSDNVKYLFVKIEKHFCESWNQFAENKFLQGENFLGWLRDVINDALEDLQLPEDIQSCEVTYSEDHAVLMLKINGTFGVSNINIVPAFNFTYDRLPENFYPNPIKDKNDVFVIPAQDISYDKRYWWPCFYDQEEELLKDKQYLQSSFWLLKKSRNSLAHSLISDYALKSMLLWDIQVNKFDFDKSLGDTFMYIIEKYKEKMGEKSIFWYWKRKGKNLLNSEWTELNVYYEEIKNLISEFKNVASVNPEFIAKIILGEETEEYREFISEVNHVQTGISHSPNVLNHRKNYPYNSFHNFDNRAINSNTPPLRSPTNPTWHHDDFNEHGAASSSLGSRSYESPERNPLRTAENNINEWAIAGAVVGAVAVVGLGIWGAISIANRNNNRR